MAGIEKYSDLDDFSLMRAEYKRAIRSVKPLKFVFKVRCTDRESGPVLIIARTGRKVKRSLLKPMKAGSPWVKGTVYREGADLIFSIQKNTNKTLMARKIYQILTEFKSRIPLRNILIITPKDMVEQEDARAKALEEREAEAEQREDRRRRYLAAEKNRMLALEETDTLEEDDTLIETVEDIEYAEEDSEEDSEEDASEESSEELDPEDLMVQLEDSLSQVESERQAALKNGDSDRAAILEQDIATLKSEKLDLLQESFLSRLSAQAQASHSQHKKALDEFQETLQKSREQDSKAKHHTQQSQDRAQSALSARNTEKAHQETLKEQLKAQSEKDMSLKKAIFAEPNRTFDLFIEHYSDTDATQNMRRSLQRTDDEDEQYELIKNWLSDRVQERERALTESADRFHQSSQIAQTQNDRLQGILLKRSIQHKKHTKRERRFAELRSAERTSAFQLMQRQLSDELENREYLQAEALSPPTFELLPEFPEINVDEASWHISEESHEDLEDIHLRFDKMERDIEHLIKQLEEGKGNATQIFARIRSSRNFLLHKVRDFVRLHPEYSEDLQLIDKLDAAIEHAQHHMEQAYLDLIQSKLEEIEAAQHAATHQSLQDITDDLLSDRNRDTPAESLLLVDPIEDLRGSFLVIRDQIRGYLKEQPALRPMYCELIRRIWDLENADIEKLELPPHRFGPAGELWDRIPSGERIATFLAGYAQWRMLEDRYWWRLGEANKRKN